jgi:UDP-2,3-diacylglucosamine hydrolase
MRTLFIADAHLQHEGDENYLAMLRFLSGLQGNTGTLFILGDFFEFWIGYRENPFTHYLPVLNALLQLRESGTNIVYFEGNHDFHMGPFFTETLHAIVHPGSASIEHSGKRIHLCHGDQLNPADIPYRVLRAVFHSRITQLLTYVVPPWVASAIAERMGRKGRENLHAKRGNPACHGLLRAYAAPRFAEGCDLVVAGHFHLPFSETSPDNPTKLMVSLGDWATRLAYAELENGTITHKTFE